MLENGSGSIVNIGSILGNGGSENGVIAYSAAKGGLSQYDYATWNRVG